MSAQLVYGSVCSGIEAATVAWKPLGWSAAFLSEVDKFPRGVLRHHYQETPLHGDFTTIKPSDYRPIDLLVGGTPCQSFSVAGLRGGLSDERGNLALEYLRLADRARPRWLVWENVPGVLSSNDGRDFGAILGGMVELGYGFAYRVLDAQFFGVAQRRRRVFVVGYLGDWRRAAAVLFERQSLRGDNPPRRQAGQGIAPAIMGGVENGGAGHGARSGHAKDGLITSALAPAITSNPYGDHESREGPLVAVDGADVSKCLSASHTASGGLDPSAETFVAHSLRAEGFDASEDGTGRGTPLVAVEAPATHGPIAFALRGREGGAMPEIGGEVSNAVRTPAGGASVPMVAASAVRRLTPRECERLQGFPDDYTAIPWRGGVAADGLRYKALGNSMAVPVMAWIGRRIQAVEDAAAM